MDALMREIARLRRELHDLDARVRLLEARARLEDVREDEEWKLRWKEVVEG